MKKFYDVSGHKFPPQVESQIDSSDEEGIKVSDLISNTWNVGKGS